jgi:putative flavoprotein involved in K+ transport
MSMSIGTAEPEQIDTVIIGAGQAGLSAGYHLAQRQREFVILDGSARVGDAWRSRWDSLRLFSPAQFDGLDGMPFPAPRDYFPTKDEMADYLESYAKHFDLPVRTSTPVDRVWREGTRFMVSAGNKLIEARNVVIAMGNFQASRIPGFASALSPEIVQLHARDYKHTGQLREGAVLIAGAGNSGAEIGLETARAGFPTFVSGPSTGEIPFSFASRAGKYVLGPFLFRVVFHRVLTTGTPIGRKLRPKLSRKGTPLIRTKEHTLAVAGATRVGRTVGVSDGKPVLDDGRVLDVANIVWCTGFDPGLSFLDLPILDAQGEPMQKRGIVESEPGLFFVGRHFQYAMSSGMVHGVGRDAEFIARAIAARAPLPSTQGAATVRAQRA